MADLIERGEAIRRLCAECSNMGSFACISCKILSTIKSIPPVNRWIPCSERIPEKDKSYITYSETTKYGTHNEIPEELRINVLYFNGEDWYNEECIYYNVTHYMPLPEPHEKE